jgi:hypothetical protein
VRARHLAFDDVTTATTSHFSLHSRDRGIRPLFGEERGKKKNLGESETAAHVSMDASADAVPQDRRLPLNANRGAWSSGPRGV